MAQTITFLTGIALRASPLSSAQATPRPCFFTGSRGHQKADGHCSQTGLNGSRRESFSSSRWCRPRGIRQFFLGFRAPSEAADAHAATAPVFPVRWSSTLRLDLAQQQSRPAAPSAAKLSHPAPVPAQSRRYSCHGRPPAAPPRLCTQPKTSAAAPAVFRPHPLLLHFRASRGVHATGASPMRERCASARALFGRYAPLQRIMLFNRQAQWCYRPFRPHQRPSSHVRDAAGLYIIQCIYDSGRLAAAPLRPQHSPAPAIARPAAGRRSKATRSRRISRGNSMLYRLATVTILFRYQ